MGGSRTITPEWKVKESLERGGTFDLVSLTKVGEGAMESVSGGGEEG